MEEVDLEKGYIAFLKEEITAQDVEEWKPLQPFSAPLPEGIRGYVQDPTEVIEGFLLFQPLVRDEDGWHLMEVNLDYEQSVPVPKDRLQPIKNIGSGVTIEGLSTTAHLETADVSTAGSPLEQLMLKFYDSIVSNRSSLVDTGMTEEQINFLETERNHITSTIVRGLKKAKTFDLFKHGLPSLKDLTTKVKSHRYLPEGTQSELAKEFVIYVNVYWYEASGDTYGSTYWGQTKQGLKRAENHSIYLGHGATKPKYCKNHYNGANKILVENEKSDWGWFPIIRITRDTFDKFGSMILAWAEQTAIALFSRYNEKLTNMPSQVGVVDQLWSAGLARKMERIVDDITHNMPQFACFDINTVFGFLGGLNWSSPMLETLRKDSPLWIGELMYGKNGEPLFYSFTGQMRPVQTERRQKPAGKEGTQKYEDHLNNILEDLMSTTSMLGTRETLQPIDENNKQSKLMDVVLVPLFSRTILRDHGRSKEKRQDYVSLVLHSTIVESEPWELEKGHMVTPIIEIMYEENAIHPHSWPALPEVGGFSTWHHVNRVAIRLEWKCRKTGKWKTRYVIPQVSFSFDDNLGKFHGTEEERQCMERHFVLATSICASFLSWEWKKWKSPADGLRSSDIEPVSVRVKMAEFDVDTHILTVTDPEPVVKDRPRLLSFDETMKRLKLRYGQDCLVGIPRKGVFINYSGSFWCRQKRADLCDSCWLPYCDWHWNDTKSEEHPVTLFRMCTQIHDRSHRDSAADSSQVCRSIECQEEWEPGQHPYTCAFCIRLRRWCTYNIGYDLWKGVDFWKTLTLYKREGKFGEKARVLSGPTGLNYILFGKSKTDSEAIVCPWDEEDVEILQGDVS